MYSVRTGNSMFYGVFGVVVVALLCTFVKFGNGSSDVNFIRSPEIKNDLYQVALKKQAFFNLLYQEIKKSITLDVQNLKFSNAIENKKYQFFANEKNGFSSYIFNSESVQPEEFCIYLKGEISNLHLESPNKYFLSNCDEHNVEILMF